VKLNDSELKDRDCWENAGFRLPDFDREEVKKRTKMHPEWVHFGVGNIFRAFPAALQQKLLKEGKADTGIIAAEGYDYGIIEKMNKPHDDLSILVTLKANGTIEKTVIGSIVESLTVDSKNEEDFKRLKEIFRNPSLQMVSFTITEKGYSLVNSKGEFLPDVTSDFEKGPVAPESYIGKLVSLCYERYCNGKLPLALVSMDNCSHNGTKLFLAVNEFTEQWAKRGLVEEDFKLYINSEKVSFPWSMIDKITPRPDNSVINMLKKSGFEDTEAIITSKNTYVAPFVNAEESEYLVIEDNFPNGRPNLESAGVIFTNRETVDKVEKMKVCTCLNPLHTALAVFGCLLSYKEIYKEMNDPQLKTLVEKIGYKEGLPVVVNPGIIKPEDFIGEVLNVRIPYPFMPDTPQRIATDTSQKLSIRFGETIKAYLAKPDLNVNDLKLIPLVFAGWCRYLMGIADEGEEFVLSSDPMLDIVCPCVKDIKLGQEGPFSNELKPILSNPKIFGVNLYEAGLGELVEAYFAEMVKGKGAVRATLIKYV
jgi:fructuronate reductase